MTEPRRFTKKPVTITAAQWFKNGDHPADYDKNVRGLEKGELREWSGMEARELGWEGQVVRYFRRPDVSGDVLCRHCSETMHVHGWIDTKEGGHIVCPGDWIITGVQGERYPCKPDIFEDGLQESRVFGRNIHWRGAAAVPAPGRERTYTMIFLFTPDLQRVLLLKKATPPWQKGLWNGPGGIVEAGETGIAGAVRELHEETRVQLTADDLTFILTFSCDCERERIPECDLHSIAVYAAIASEEQLLAAKGTEAEPVQLMPVKSEAGRVNYLPSLLDMAKIRLMQCDSGATPKEGQ